MNTATHRWRFYGVAVVIGSVLTLASGPVGRAQVIAGQAVDGNGAPLYRVDPFWPKALPNRWSMQQVTGLHVDHMNHIWFLNRGRAAVPTEIGGDSTGGGLCCVLGPEVIELDQEGKRGERVGRSRLSSIVADLAADGDRRHQRLRLGSPARRRRTAF